MSRMRFVAVACAAALFAGCGGGLKSIDISQQAPIAVVGFSMNKSIVQKDKAPDQGPGLLQKSENYYQHHQEAVEALWSELKAQYRDLCLGAEVVDIEKVAADENYQKLTKHVPKVMLGKDIAPGNSVLVPSGGLNYISTMDKDKLEKVATMFGAKLLMTIDYSAYWAMNAGLEINGIGGGAGKMWLRAVVSMYEPGKGVVLVQSFEESSDEQFPVVQGIMLSDNYAKGLTSANKKLLPKIKSYFEAQKSKANETAAK